MSWMHRLYETYEQCAQAPQFAEDPPLPISHTTQQAHIEIVLDGSGGFLRASVVAKKLSTTLIPCTEGSGNRSGSRPVNHPLSDKLQYVAGDFAAHGGDVTTGYAQNPKEPFDLFLADLTAWQQSDYQHPKSAAVLAYVRRETTVADLVREIVLPTNASGNLLSEWTGDRRGRPEIFSVLKDPRSAVVRWLVELPNDPNSTTWDDQSLIRSWISYYTSTQRLRGVCIVTGATTILAQQHPAKLRNAGDKAKLISANDTSGFTFRGRFALANQACTVGFETSQKAHSALRWLISRQRTHRNGDQVSICWSVGGKPVPDPFGSLEALLGDETDAVASGEETALAIGDAGQAFARRLALAMAGYRAELSHSDKIVVMVVDSATPGRLAVPYYRELTGSELLERVQTWQSRYAWPQDYGIDSKSGGHVRFTAAPATAEIIVAAHGPSKDAKKKLQKATFERLVPCIIDGHEVPRDLVDLAIRRTCNRLGFERGGKRREYAWERNLGVACALYRGFNESQEYKVALEENRTTRDYLFGRLLALAEQIERTALRVANETRDTSAARLMQRFADRPSSTWRTLELALVPYKSRLRASRGGYLFNVERRVDGVIAAFDPVDFLNDARLSGEFLLGYHCERSYKPPTVSSTATVPSIGEATA